MRLEIGEAKAGMNIRGSDVESAVVNLRSLSINFQGSSDVDKIQMLSFGSCSSTEVGHSFRSIIVRNMPSFMMRPLTYLVSAEDFSNE